MRRWMSSLWFVLLIGLFGSVSIDGMASPGPEARAARREAGTPPTATISSAWWTNLVDEDGDTYLRSAWLNWDPDVEGESASLTVYEKIYWKLASSSTWTLSYTTSPHVIAGNSTADRQSLAYTGGGHNLYDWSIEVYRSDVTSPDYTLGPAEDGDLNDVKMETAGEDTLSTTMTLKPATLRFAGTNTNGTLGPITGPQTVSVTFTGAGATAWSVAASQPWVQITNGACLGNGQFTVSIINPGNVLGIATGASAIVTVTAAGAIDSPQTVAVELTLRPAAGTTAPFGVVDTPAQNAEGQVGAIGVTGWVLDDVGVKSVKLYRNCLAFEPAINCILVNNVDRVYVGDATLVAGARPDIESTYPAYPQNTRAAWGYLLLTNMLPHVPNQLMFGGQGTLTLYVLAEDMEGHQRWLGRDFLGSSAVLTDEVPTTFTMANDTIAKPFGAIDTPAQGETVSGSFWNFGWTLTPDRNTTADSGDILMPPNGGTQWVYIDGVPVGTLGAYNLCRGHAGSPPPDGVYCDDDVSSIFGNPTPLPTYTPRAANQTRHRNLDAGRGPIAAYYLDTTTLGNGIHTIAWGVTDSAGRGEGIGSRYFNVLNTGCSARPDGTGAADASCSRAGAAVPGVEPMAGQANADAAPLTQAARGDASALDTLAPAAGRVLGRTGFDLTEAHAELASDDAGVRHVRVPALGRLELGLGLLERGYLVANGTLRDLPPGSNLNLETGVFTWSPGLGYLGTYRLVFVRPGEQIVVDVTIQAPPPASPLPVRRPPMST